MKASAEKIDSLVLAMWRGGMMPARIVALSSQGDECVILEVKNHTDNYPLLHANVNDLLFVVKDSSPKKKVKSAIGKIGIIVGGSFDHPSMVVVEWLDDENSYTRENLEDLFETL